MFSLEQFPLKFARDALVPYMSQQTLEFHYDKHLDTYIKNLNSLAAGTTFEALSLAEIVVDSVTDMSAKKIFNNAAQVFNHYFFFCGMVRDSTAKIPAAIEDTFGGADKFAMAFKDAAMSVFGSGWTWLIRDESGAFKIITTTNADTPIAHGMKPLLTLDVWEHAYYLDYQNKRADFTDAFLAHLIDWDFVAENMK